MCQNRLKSFKIVRIKYTFCKEGFQKSFENIDISRLLLENSKAATPTSSSPSPRVICVLLFHQEFGYIRLFCPSCGCPVIMTWGLRCSHLMPRKPSTPMMYSLRAPLEPAESIWMFWKTVTLASFLFFWSVAQESDESNAITRASGLVSSNWYYPSFSIARNLRRFSKSGGTVDGSGQRKSRTATIISLNIEILLSNVKRRG